MIGQLVLKNGKILINGLDTPIDNVESIINTDTHKRLESEDVFIQYVTNQDLITITKIYNEDFGTTREGVSIAYKRYEENDYPLNGFTPGNDTIICKNCDNYFVGNKKSKRCERCAIKSVDSLN